MVPDLGVRHGWESLVMKLSLTATCAASTFCCRLQPWLLRAHVFLVDASDDVGCVFIASRPEGLAEFLVEDDLNQGGHARLPSVP